MPSREDLAVAQVDVNQSSDLQPLLESNAECFRRVQGFVPTPAASRDILTSMPPEASAEQKIVLGLWRGEELTAVVDVILGWPDASVAHIGLLMTHGQHHNQGLGRRMHDAAIDLVRAHGVIGTLRITIVDTNADLAEPFWSLLGYQQTGEATEHCMGTVTSTARVWTRPMVP